jgi:hypothetical protein
MGDIRSEPMRNPEPATYDTARPYRVNLSHLTDEQILADLQAGNDDALAVLFDRYHRLVYSIAMKIVNNPRRLHVNAFLNKQDAEVFDSRRSLSDRHQDVNLGAGFAVQSDERCARA